ncbi:MAG: hypothetical protein JOZ15_18590 [Acidobacteria bacterium]|nr:hypothetical protein [Acidobacteriota bacterium]
MADPSTTPVSPFNPSAVQVPRDGPGCSKPLLIGCGFVVLLLVIGVVVIRLEAPAIIRWTFHLAETSLAPRLPADATPAERQRLHQAFEAAGRSVGSEQTDLASLQRVQREIMALSSPQAPLTHQQVRELTEALESLARKPGTPAPAPSPASGSGPGPGSSPGSSPGPGPGSGPGQPPQRPPSGDGARSPAPAGPIAAAVGQVGLAAEESIHRRR